PADWGGPPITSSTAGVGNPPRPAEARYASPVRIGIFGGTFDPVHDGHVNPVARAAERFGLARVIWIPARVSPLKGAPPTDARHRVAMVALAIDGRSDWVLSFDELDRQPPSYTVDTLSALSARFLRDELWL